MFEIIVIVFIVGFLVGGLAGLLGASLNMMSAQTDERLGLK